MLIGNDEEEQRSACLKPERKTVQSADDWTTTMREDQLTGALSQLDFSSARQFSPRQPV